METPGQADNQRDLAIQANKKKVRFRAKGVEQYQNNANLITGDKDALHGGHPLRHLLVPLPSIQLSLLPPVPPEVRTMECVVACSLIAEYYWRGGL